jgi:hypothetical protein
MLEHNEISERDFDTLYRIAENPASVSGRLNHTPKKIPRSDRNYSEHQHLVLEKNAWVNKAKYLFCKELPYLIITDFSCGYKIIPWDFYVQPSIHKWAGPSIVAKYGEEDSQVLVYPLFMVEDIIKKRQRWTIPWPVFYAGSFYLSGV